MSSIHSTRSFSSAGRRWRRFSIFSPIRSNSTIKSSSLRWNYSIGIWFVRRWRFFVRREKISTSSKRNVDDGNHFWRRDVFICPRRFVIDRSTRFDWSNSIRIVSREKIFSRSKWKFSTPFDTTSLDEHRISSSPSFCDISVSQAIFSSAFEIDLVLDEQQKMSTEHLYKASMLLLVHIYLQWTSLAEFLAKKENGSTTINHQQMESVNQRLRDPLLVGSATILAASKMFFTHGTNSHLHDKVNRSLFSLSFNRRSS